MTDPGASVIAHLSSAAVGVPRTVGAFVGDGASVGVRAVVYGSGSGDGPCWGVDAVVCGSGSDDGPGWGVDAVVCGSGSDDGPFWGVDAVVCGSGSDDGTRWGADAVGVGEGALGVGDVGVLVVAAAAAEVDSPGVTGAFMSLWI